jgi:regulator of nucleoside diphosphate kinase
MRRGVRALLITTLRSFLTTHANSKEKTEMDGNLNREPPITLIKDDFDKLSRLAALRNNSPVADYLAYELDRAQVVERPSHAGSVARLGSRIIFRDPTKCGSSEVTLVMPNEADIAKGYISVMTPVGAALLGLAKAQTITFTLPNGDARTLVVLDVDNEHRTPTSAER